MSPRQQGLAFKHERNLPPRHCHSSEILLFAGHRAPTVQLVFVAILTYGSLPHAPAPSSLNFRMTSLSPLKGFADHAQDVRTFQNVFDVVYLPSYLMFSWYSLHWCLTAVLSSFSDAVRNERVAVTFHQGYKAFLTFSLHNSHRCIARNMIYTHGPALVLPNLISEY